MTIREILCQAGVNTLREYMCLPVGGGGVVINSQLVKVETMEDIKVEVESDVILIAKTEVVEVEVKSDIIKIKELKREVINVIR